MYDSSDEHTIVGGVLDAIIRYEVPLRIGQPEFDASTGTFNIMIFLKYYLSDPRGNVTSYNATILDTPRPILVFPLEILA